MADLREVRVRITVETDAVLDSVARVLDKDRGEIAREVLHKWAAEHIRIARLTEQRLRAEGVSAAPEGACAACEGAAWREEARR